VVSGKSPELKEPDIFQFCSPSGRFFRWCCMPFGFEGAPGIFQELMEQVCNKTGQQIKLKFPDLKLVFLGAFSMMWQSLLTLKLITLS